MPNPSRENRIFGGNTQCVAVPNEESCILLDGGTGILSAPLQPECKIFHILLSHYHLDHITGIPLFMPLFDPGCTVCFYGAEFEGKDVKRCLDEVFKPPYWPVRPHAFLAQVEYYTVVPASSFWIGDICVSTIALNHPNGSVGYKLEQGGKTFCYISDHEHIPAYDEPISHFVQNCELMLCDAPYTLAQYQSKRIGFGHSAIEDVAAVAHAAQVSKLIITHHDGKNNDQKLAFLEQELQKEYPNYLFAREGMVLVL